jgi:hypothetical protein
MSRFCWHNWPKWRSTGRIAKVNPKTGETVNAHAADLQERECGKCGKRQMR